MINKYIVKVHAEGTYYAGEDPRCPSEWRGSGCYDVYKETECDVEIEVWASSFADAEKIADKFDVSADTTIILDDRYIVSITFERVLNGRDDEEAGIIEPVNIEWKDRN